MRSHRVLLLAAVLGASMHAASSARATDIPMTFASLPSAQGWTFSTGGSPLATEAVAFSVSGGVLTLNTMSYGYTGAGTSAYYTRTGVVNNFEPIVMRMRGRLVQFEGDFANIYVGGGFLFGFTHGSQVWAMGITPTQIRNIAGTLLSSAYDNTQFHDYRLEWNPPSTVRYYVDNTLISSTPGALSQALNRVIIGDVTGASNSHAEIKEFRFMQGASTASEPSTWGRIKSLYR